MNVLQKFCKKKGSDIYVQKKEITIIDFKKTIVRIEFVNNK